MKFIKRHFILFLILFSLVNINAQNESSEKTLVAFIDINNTKEPISKYLYGMFMENLGNEDVGNLTDDCLWAELLDDRKFFYPVDTIEVLTPINRKEKINQWKPVNTPLAVVMDSVDPYVGLHSPKIHTTQNSEEGIFQSGIAIQKNKQYTGRIILKSTPDIVIKVSFSYGDENQSVEFKKVSQEYAQYNFSFNSKEDNPKASLQITGLGKGSFSIGAVSLMPSDNVDGFRPDVIELLKDLNSGIYRWGGNFISGYDWRDGIGNPDKRAPRYEFAWHCLEDNDVGTYEMIRLSQLVNVELSMTVNTGFGDAYSAAQWVEYVNGPPESEMGKLRAKHGNIEPFDIKLWCVGNESYGWWQLGHINLKDHIIKHNMFAEEMLKKDPSIKLIGSGASIEEMTITESSFRTNGEVIPVYGSDTDWTGGMLKKANHLSFISEHFYCSVNERFNLEKVKYVEVDEPLEDWTRRPANRIKAKSEHYKEYHKKIPGSENIPIYLDEWAYYTNWVHPKPTLGVTIGYARALNEMFRHTDLIKMAGFTFATSCLSFTDTDVSYNATGLMFKLYQSKLGSTPLIINGNSPQPRPKWPVGGEQPKENAGGNLYPLDAVATISEEGDIVSIAIVNPTENNHEITLDFGNATIGKKINRWTISGTSLEARNIVDEEQEVQLKETTISTTNALRIDATTINVFQFQVL